MWIPFVHSETNYMLKVVMTENQFRIFLTDFKNLWFSEKDKNDFITSFKEMNKLFSGSDEEVLKESVKMLNEVTTVPSLTKTGTTCCLELSSKFQELSIRIKCELEETNNTMFYKEVTVPLIKTVQFLELKKNKLTESIIAKDKEILEYNMEFGEISRKNIITKKFEKEKGEKIDNLLINVFTKTDSFYDNFGRQHGDIQQKFPELKEIKVEKKKLTLPKSKKRKYN